MAGWSGTEIKGPNTRATLLFILPPSVYFSLFSHSNMTIDHGLKSTMCRAETTGSAMNALCKAVASIKIAPTAASASTMAVRVGSDDPSQHAPVAAADAAAYAVAGVLALKVQADIAAADARLIASDKKQFNIKCIEQVMSRYKSVFQVPDGLEMLRTAVNAHSAALGTLGMIDTYRRRYGGPPKRPRVSARSGSAPIARPAPLLPWR